MTENSLDQPQRANEVRTDASRVAIAAIIAALIVILACLAACTAVALVFLYNAPWQ